MFRYLSDGFNTLTAKWGIIAVSTASNGSSGLDQFLIFPSSWLEQWETMSFEQMVSEVTKIAYAFIAVIGLIFGMVKFIMALYNYFKAMSEAGTQRVHHGEVTWQYKEDMKESIIGIVLFTAILTVIGILLTLGTRSGLFKGIDLDIWDWLF